MPTTGWKALCLTKAKKVLHLDTYKIGISGISQLVSRIQHHKHKSLKLIIIILFMYTSQLNIDIICTELSHLLCQMLPYK